MDWKEIIFIFLVIALFVAITGKAVSEFYQRKLSSKTNEYERAVRRAAYNKTKLCLDDGTFYDVTIYRMDGNREFYIVKPVK